MPKCAAISRTVGCWPARMPAVMKARIAVCRAVIQPISFASGYPVVQAGGHSNIPRDKLAIELRLGDIKSNAWGRDDDDQDDKHAPEIRIAAVVTRCFGIRDAPYSNRIAPFGNPRRTQRPTDSEEFDPASHRNWMSRRFNHRPPRGPAEAMSFVDQCRESSGPASLSRSVPRGMGE